MVFLRSGRSVGELFTLESRSSPLHGPFDYSVQYLLRCRRVIDRADITLFCTFIAGEYSVGDALTRTESLRDAAIKVCYLVEEKILGGDNLKSYSQALEELRCVENFVLADTHNMYTWLDVTDVDVYLYIMQSKISIVEFFDKEQGHFHVWRRLL